MAWDSVGQLIIKSHVKVFFQKHFAAFKSQTLFKNVDFVLSLMFLKKFGRDNKKHTKIVHVFVKISKLKIDIPGHPDPRLTPNFLYTY